jgi:hypothetical protein
MRRLAAALALAALPAFPAARAQVQPTTGQIPTYEGLTFDGTGPVAREFVLNSFNLTAQVRPERLRPFLPQGAAPLLAPDGTATLYLFFGIGETYEVGGELLPGPGLTNELAISTLATEGQDLKLVVIADYMDAPPGVREALGAYGFIVEPACIGAEVARCGRYLTLGVQVADASGRPIAAGSVSAALDAVTFDNVSEGPGATAPVQYLTAASPHAVHEFDWIDQANASFDATWSWTLDVPGARLAVLGGSVALDGGSAGFLDVENGHAFFYRRVAP